MTESLHFRPGQTVWPSTTTEGRPLSVTNASAPVTRKAPELAHEADILIVGFREERLDFQQFRHQQVYAAASPLTRQLIGRRFRRAYYTDGAMRIQGFDRLLEVLHDGIAKGAGEMVVHVTAYERLAEHDGDAELLRSLRQARAFEA
ncbi:hypothetical protein ALI22I_33725 [Saccharothrix sp. ALI-22-I]|uniref:hypothetical protein n=1 Tax=Saccharothrix sp. ALI-22-I TaxID=1933778 RepID=UPI00097C649C|nr:hypothetical protein [Saccharothrix sp. ALI-22-I]ONI83464.1 hypothetical protein ALI22I_33725 [Saccharothrix sp. ALI-22-I]